MVLPTYKKIKKLGEREQIIGISDRNTRIIGDDTLICKVVKWK